MDQAKRGADALTAGNYAEAIKQFTSAIKVSPTSPDYLIKRSTAYQRSSPADYTHALSDAENAVIFAKNRAKRELIIQAQLRRGIALFGLERYADAGFVFEIVKKMDPKEKTLPIWENKVATKLAALPEGDARGKVTAQETPEASVPEEPVVEEADSEDEAPASAPVAVKKAPTSYRQDWYQSNNSVTFALLAKGVPKDQAEVLIEPRALKITFPTGFEKDNGEPDTFTHTVSPLFGPVDPAQSSFKVMSTKIEVTLSKAQPGVKWHSLEGTDGNAPEISTAASITKTQAPAAAGPVYPTSSRSGPKNWDRLVNDLTAPKKKKKEPTDSAAASSSTTTADAKTGGGDEDDDDDYDYDAAEGGGDPTNAFFQKLYASADPDTRRAMMKSFSESNGTALSTNWEEVGKKTVETMPPEGMEAKKY